MKKIFLTSLLIIISVLAFAAFYIKNPILSVETTQCIPADSTLLKQHVEFLTTIKPARSVKHPEGLEQAADYIFSQFSKNGLNPEEQKFQVNGTEYKNIRALYGPADKPRIVIGAHYDVFDDLPGADDNASGVAGLLEIGRLLGSMKPDLPYSIELVAYTNEEPPFFRTPYMGSAIHVKSLKEANVKVKFMVSLEMIGYFSDKEGSQKFPVSAMKALYPSTGNFIAVVGKMDERALVRNLKKNMMQCESIPVESINAPASVRGIDFSDHQNYWSEGFPALMITDTSFYRNPNYHEESDTIETLDFGKMAGVVEAVYHAVTNWSN